MAMPKSGRRRRDGLRVEYDFSILKGAVHGKYYRRAIATTNLVLLDPDVAQVFPDSKTVNETLRAIAHLARQKLGSPRRRKSAA